MIAKHTLHAYQEANIARVLAEPTKAALIASDMGKGKTTVASEFIVRAGLKRVLVIGVKDTFDQWFDRLEAQSDGTILLRVLDASAAGKRNFAAFLAGEAGAFFVGSQYLTAQDYRLDPVLDDEGQVPTRIDAKHPSGTATFAVSAAGVAVKTKVIKDKIHLKTYAKMAPLDAVIFDEVHVSQNRKSDAHSTIKTVRSTWKIALSGTPYGNKFPGIWAVCRWLWPTIIDRSFIRWTADWCVTEPIRGTGGQVLTGKRGDPLISITGERFPGAFVAQLPCYIRDEADEKVPAAKIVYVELGAQQRADYEALEEDCMVYLKRRGTFKPATTEGEMAALVADLPITLRSRLRTATLGVMSLSDDDEIYFDINTESTKLNAMRGILDMWGAQPVIIGTDSKRFAKVVVARMRAAGYNAVEWSGDVTTKGRAEIKAAFLAGQVQYLVVTIPSFSTGLDGFQTVCNKVLWLSESENQIVNDQFIHRTFRPGMTEANGGFAHVKLLARDTHDVGIYRSLQAQHADQKMTLKIAA